MADPAFCLRPCLVEFMMLTPRRRFGLGVILCGLSFALLAVILAGSIPPFSQPRHRAHAGKFRLSLWSGEGSCRSMGCESDNYVGSCQCNLASKDVACLPLLAHCNSCTCRFQGNDGCTYFDDCCPDYQEVCTSAGQYEPPAAWLCSLHASRLDRVVCHIRVSGTPWFLPVHGLWQ